jgi:hypothetical protein
LYLHCEPVFFIRRQKRNHFLTRGPLVADLQFDDVYPWVVKSVRQARLLDAWLEAYRAQHTLPDLSAFAALDDYAAPEELLVCDVVSVNNAIRLRIVRQGASIATAFGPSGTGGFLDDAISPFIWRHAGPIYHESVARGLPVYSVFSVFDNSRQKNLYERLVLPFRKDATASGSEAAAIVASLKATSWEAQPGETFGPAGADPEYQMRAVIALG